MEPKEDSEKCTLKKMIRIKGLELLRKYRLDNKRSTTVFASVFQTFKI